MVVVVTVVVVVEAFEGCLKLFKSTCVVIVLFLAGLGAKKCYLAISSVCQYMYALFKPRFLAELQENSAL